MKMLTVVFRASVFLFMVSYPSVADDHRAEIGHPAGLMSICIYAGDGKPSDLDALLGPFVAEMIQLQDGFTVASKSQREIKVHVKIRAIICDSPARAMIKGPGSTKPAVIPKSQLKYLSFVVQGNGRTRQKYSYWNARNIAKDPRINFKRRTLLVAIGYLDSPNLPISAMFANEYEDRGYNVILVDNQRFATVHYHLATRLMRPVGKHVAEILVQLTQYGLDPSKLELLGFSLGCHTAGFIAKHFHTMTGRNISTIAALEPSGPCFRNLGPKDRLDASDADFVQVIHTNIDGYGMATPMGHVDIYVNGGEYQPSDINIYPCTTTCSHFRVLPLWVSALKNPRKFIGMKCKDIQQARDSACYSNVPTETTVMGSDIDRRKRGIFYLATTMEYPFYLGAKGLKEENVYWKKLTDINSGDDTEIYT